MSLFKRKIDNSYVSEVTNFIDNLKKENPNLEKEQLHGRNLLWDKGITFQQQKDFKRLNLPKNPYEYY